MITYQMWLDENRLGIWICQDCKVEADIHSIQWLYEKGFIRFDDGRYTCPECKKFNLRYYSMQTGRFLGR